jgi:hypothetical protein
MHEREKSDPAIGAGKPTNKAEATPVSAAAEPVEQRSGAKGNASEQSTHRTQGRERVSQALERVRKAARLRRKEKLTALLHHINVDLLREAFFARQRLSPETQDPSSVAQCSLCRHHPRWEPDALMGPVRICAGGAG